jgi:hypothetical protein
MALAKEALGLSGGTAQSLNGVYSTVAATGTVQTDAAAVGSSLCVVTGADGNKGVILGGDLGDEYTVVNNSGSTLKVWPPSGAAIVVPATGMGNINTAYPHTTYAVCKYQRLTATQYSVIKSA